MMFSTISSKEMQTKTIIITTTHLLEWLKFKRPTIPSVEENVEQLKLSYTAEGNVKWCNHFATQFLKKLNKHLPEPAIPLIGINSRLIKTYIHTKVCS